MELAHVLLIMTAIPMVAVIVICLYKYVLVKRYPEIIADRESRRWFRRARVVMALMCAGMIWKDIWFLDQLVWICSIDPVGALIGHLPVTLPAYAAAICEGWHLRRKIEQAQAIA